MSKDIRSFFKVLPKKTENKLTLNKKKSRILDSDDEDIIEATPPPSKKTLKPININEVFTKAPVKQTEVPKVEEKEDSPAPKKRKRGKNKESTVHNDESFSKTLMELDQDNDLLESNIDLLDKTIEDAREESKSSSNERKRSRKSSSDSPNKKAKLEHTDSGIDPDQERFEKKRYSAMLYQKFLNRSEPKNKGLKEYPIGKPDCLNGLCFMKTGVLDSLDSEGLQNLAKKHGGRCVQAVSKKVNYILVGEDPGPSKLEKARNYNIPTITEDEFLDMILVKSGKKPKFVKKAESSQDLGVEMDIDSSPTSSKEKTKKKEKSPKNVEKSHIKVSKSLKTEDKPVSSTSKVEKAKKVDKKAPNVVLKKSEIKPLNLSITDKYKPKSLKNIIGQQSNSSNMNKLIKWLEMWYHNQKPEIHKTLPKPSPWSMSSGNGAYFKCALLSGPPGIGKTTTATLVAKELGYDIVEFNASDTRNKKLLHQEVGQLLGTNTIAGFATGNSMITKKRVLIMDEVDGMAGNEDRGGMQELISLIKTTNIPIICICNDRQHQKIRSLVNYCFDLRFTKPNLEQIKTAMVPICEQENIQIPSQALSEIILGTNCDIRQTLNHIQMYKNTEKELTIEQVGKEAQIAKKDNVFNTWEVCRKIFSYNEQKQMSIMDKSKLFFFDYSLGPLFVQENYLTVQPHNATNLKERLRRITLTAESLSIGDIIESKIRRTNNWSLLETQAFYHCVIPAFHMCGDMKSVQFPQWLGKNSKRNKIKRIINEIHTHTRTSTSGSRMALLLDYLIPLRNSIVLPLLTKKLDGVDQAVNVMQNYCLTREDLDNLFEIDAFGNNNVTMQKVDTKVKAAFTRNYNKIAAPITITKKKTVLQQSDDFIDDNEEEEINEEEEDNIDNDVMIKQKKKTVKKSTNEKKNTESKKGKGKKGK